MTLQEFIQQIDKCTQVALNDLQNTNWYKTYLGKTSEIHSFSKIIRDFSNDDKKAAGRYLQEAKNLLQDKCPVHIDSTHQIKYDLSTYPIQTLGAKHPLEAIQNDIFHVFSSLGFEYIEGPDIESVYYNFDALNTSINHPSRSKQDTFYIKDKVLRTHTTSVQARMLEKSSVPFKGFTLGSVYRRDDDATHTPMFHQFDCVILDYNLTVEHKKTFIEKIVRLLLPNANDVRFRPSYFPFTFAGAEVDIKLNGKWLELLGCGMIHPNILKLNPNKSPNLQGIACGWGIERLAMLKYEVTDIRHFYKNDVEFLNSINYL